MHCDEVKTQLRNEILKYLDMIMKCLHEIKIIQRYAISN